MTWKGGLPKSPEAAEPLVKSQSFEHFMPTHTSNDFSRNNDVNFRT
jgi:hypothetical protein